MLQEPLIKVSHPHGDMLISPRVLIDRNQPLIIAFHAKPRGYKWRESLFTILP